VRSTAFASTTASAGAVRSEAQGGSVNNLTRSRARRGRDDESDRHASDAGRVVPATPLRVGTGSREVHAQTPRARRFESASPEPANRVRAVAT
jgi:hypothetical protein